MFETMRALAWKLAARAFVLCDWDGFREAALPGEFPGGALRWTARLLTSAGLVDGCWWVPYASSGLLLSGAAYVGLFGLKRPYAGKGGVLFRWVVRAALPVAFLATGLGIVLGPLIHAGVAVYSDTEPSFAIFNALGLACTLLLVRALLPLARRGGWYFAAAMLVAGICFIPLGDYAILGQGVILIFRFFDFSIFRFSPCCRWRFNRTIDESKNRKIPTARISAIGSALALAILFLTVPACCRFVYDDLNPILALAEGHAVRLYRDDSRFLQPQLDMERLASRNDFAGVLVRAARGGDFPLRMEIAYRILAQYRCGTLPDELFRFPIRTHHATTDATQLVMDGYILLFHYGFMLPARREIFERMFGAGAEPEHYRYLGDIAFIRNEKNLARRDYLLYARCPFRRAWAERRLAALDDPAQKGVADLVPIAAAANFWTRWNAESGNVFFSTDERVEDYIYNRFSRLKAASPDMARMAVAAALLCGDANKLANNAALLDHFCPPPQPWPVPVQEALLAAGLEKRVRADAFSEAVRARFAAWRVDAVRRDRNVLRARYGDTYWLYRHWISSH